MTEATNRVFRLIVQHFAEHGRPPTVREVQQAAGFASPNALTYHLQALEKHGLIVRERGTSRGIEVPAIRDAAKAAAKSLLQPEGNERG